MRRTKLILILVALISTIVPGCNPFIPLANAVTKFRTPEVYIPADSVAELRGPVAVPVWYTADGKRKKGYVQAYDRYLIGPSTPVPLKVSDLGPATNVTKTPEKGK